MRNFWIFFAVIFACLSLSLSVMAQTANPSNEEMAEHVKKDKILTCDDAAECADKAREERRKNTITLATKWVECEIPTEYRIERDDGQYMVRETQKKARLEGNQCVCPEGFHLSKSAKLAERYQRGGKTYQRSHAYGVCLPLNTEPNAQIIADALNRHWDFIKKTNVNVAQNANDIVAVMKYVDDTVREVAYNTGDIADLRDRVEGFERFYLGACSTPDLPPAWQELCDALKLKHRQKEMSVHAAFELAHFAGGRDFVGGGVGGAWYPALSDTVRWELGGRLTLANGQDMTEHDADDAAAVMGTVYTGPTFLAQEDGQVQVHVRAMVQQAYRIDGFEAMSGGVGPELGVSFCPSSEADAPLSFCVQPFLNLGYGRSGYPEKADPNANVPNHYREETGWRVGGGLTLGGQF